ncbi:GLPGLI family protein [uncultured Flavobacterium sp.]|uniref:GLPGLI family protein n=1 Tax=uncultured Flavobacterium sp. TaxID=165435 RepID=UPI0030C7E226
MNKIIVILLLLINQSTFSQTKGRVTYKSYFSESIATEELKKKNRIEYQEALDEEMMAKMLFFNLDFNKEESLFYLSSNLISDYENQNRKKYIIGLFYGLDEFYINRETDSLIEQQEYSFGIILKKKRASFIEWKLTNEEKQINGYKCLKATYTYIQKWKGREFPWKVEAWYCPEIPVSLGPIRYSGLPGLILQLHEKNCGFIVDKIEFDIDEIKIKKPNKGEVISDDEIKKRDNEVKSTLIEN